LRNFAVLAEPSSAAGVKIPSARAGLLLRAAAHGRRAPALVASLLVRTGFIGRRELPVHSDCSILSSVNSCFVKGNFAQMSSDEDNGFSTGPDADRGLAVEEAKPKTKKPPLFRVVLLNDDYTPMEFVVEVLERIFGMDRPQATRIMLEVHTQGKGVCGVFTYEIAETKVAQVSGFADQHQHPLLCTLEEI